MRLDWSVVWTHREALLQGAFITVLLTALTMLIAVPGGIVLMLLRQSRLRLLRGIGVSIVEFFRNLPLILLVYWAYYVVPILVDVQLSAFTTGLVALALNVSAYNAETFRAGVNSIRKAQTDAALAIGMSQLQAMRKIVLPQAVRRILPVLASTWVSLFKDTSLVSVIAVGDLAHTALQIRSQTFRVLEMLTAMATLYWLMGYPQAKLVDWIHRRYGVTE
jgi:His/Glu/Gln/Arg/opine family amino acid ABC transporter permease subunit